MNIYYYQDHKNSPQYNSVEVIIIIKDLNLYVTFKI